MKTRTQEIELEYKEVSQSEFMRYDDITKYKGKYAETPDGKKYYDVGKADYPSKKNEIGLYGYPEYGSSIFLPRGTKFFVRIEH